MQSASERGIAESRLCKPKAYLAILRNSVSPDPILLVLRVFVLEQLFADRASSNFLVRCSCLWDSDSLVQQLGPVGGLALRLFSLDDGLGGLGRRIGQHPFLRCTDGTGKAAPVQLKDWHDHGKGNEKLTSSVANQLRPTARCAPIPSV